MGDHNWLGTVVVRPYTADLVQITVPKHVADRYQLEAGNRLWVEVLDDGFALRSNGPMDQVDPPKRSKR